METVGHWLWSREWWRHGRPPSALSDAYHWFNLAEGIVWLVLAGLVAARAARNERRGLEWCYAAAFAAFGLTDFREAFALHSWLIWLKGINLAVLLWLRAIVIRRHYPHSRTF
jgi:hypothetical protein